MLRSEKIKKFVILLSVLLGFISLVDLSFYFFKSEITWPALKSVITLILSVFMYLSLTRSELFKR